MRGSHDGSYDYAHTLRDGNFWKSARDPRDTGETYDLVVVGGGISGLAAATSIALKPILPRRFSSSTITTTLAAMPSEMSFVPADACSSPTAGRYPIESPFDYSKQARGLISELGIDPETLEAKSEKITDRSAFQGLQGAFFFDKETFGVRTVWWWECRVEDAARRWAAAGPRGKSSSRRLRSPNRPRPISRACRKSTSTTCPDFPRREKGQAIADQLQRFSAERGQGSS